MFCILLFGVFLVPVPYLATRATADEAGCDYIEEYYDPERDYSWSYRRSNPLKQIGVSNAQFLLLVVIPACSQLTCYIGESSVSSVATADLITRCTAAR